MGVERIADLVGDVARHRAIHVCGQFDEARLEASFLGFPREIKGVNRDAVTAKPWPWMKGHEAERLRLRGIDNLPYVDAHPVAHQRELVDEPDVDSSEGVLEQFDHLCHLRR